METVPVLPLHAPKMLFIVILLLPLTFSQINTHDYCVLGAGPGGIQIAKFLEEAGRDYIVFERNLGPGSFFYHFPRHRKLISINKRFTGRMNKEFNLRHDWNSLLSQDEHLRFFHYSHEFFPHADDMVRYLNNFSSALNVHYGKEIRRVKMESNLEAWHGHYFVLEDQMEQEYMCKAINNGLLDTYQLKSLDGLLEGDLSDLALIRDDSGKLYVTHKHYLKSNPANNHTMIPDSMLLQNNLDNFAAREPYDRVIRCLGWKFDFSIFDSVLLVATGLALANKVKFSGEEYAEGYETVSIDPSNFTGQSVLILGRGNSAFETALNILSSTNFIHMIGRSRVRLSLSTHYVGDLRSIKLKSSSGLEKKYPILKPNYEAKHSQGLFVVGTASHGIDFRKSAGGFIHGFRYTARSVHRIMENRYHNIPWPSTHYSLSQLLNVLLKRINEASGLYQMFEVLVDVILLGEDSNNFEHLEEVPAGSIPTLGKSTGRKVYNTGVFILVMEYGKNFSGPDKDVFHYNRAIGDAKAAWLSNFLHPIIYYYKQLPSGVTHRLSHAQDGSHHNMTRRSARNNPTCGTMFQVSKIHLEWWVEEDFLAERVQYHQIPEQQMTFRPQGWPLPRPTQIHHVVEDFLTDWTGPNSHMLPLRRFLENCLQRDLRTFYADSCFVFSLTHQTLPIFCKQKYLQGQGLKRKEELRKLTNPLGFPMKMEDKAATSYSQSYRKDEL
ncbi:FAD-dependent oxidoreductase domain-containing protein 2 isoform X5 [Dendrobates tinctorius]|uniref:FAD-dependent oxidoreductase domain-containing protein 2 isoform X5 n=1 Tax=Dendrobates tinctorius TaxID=92724 RepID=UPI003CCA57DB